MGKGGTIVSSFRVTRNFGLDRNSGGNKTVRNEEIATRYTGGAFCIVRYRDRFSSSLSFAPCFSRSFVSNVFPTMASLSLSRRCRGQQRLIRKLCGKERKERRVHAAGSSLHYSKRPSRETRAAKHPNANFWQRANAPSAEACHAK